ncbi:hypothetical protein Cfor_02991 [Coptotermes formosanus]|uniref:MARVEL domain-containing protein n=1 Tax=Coptotermes formosanus TaxID=36987 RepID=A0A6L2P920_COPFO|nr:hypothetical protein Cfor_02991 [Coptotermes formosanus]
MVKTRDLLRMPTFIMKVTELVVTIICVALVTDMWYVAMTPAKTAIVNGTFVGYILLSTVIILGLILDTPLDRTLVLVVTLPGAVMFFASGSIMMQAWNNFGSQADRLLLSGVLSFLNGFVYLVDFVLNCFRSRLPCTR